MRPALHSGAKLAVGLYRVSTAEQGHSGLGLEAQQASVRAFVAAQAWTLVAEHSDVASGKDERRPDFQSALARCRQLGAVLVSARLDRITRRADSDEGGHPFQSHRGHHSNLMAARPDHPRRSILLMSWSGNQGQAAARSLRRLSPLSSMRWAAWTTRSRTASARVGSPTISYQRPIGTWLVMISEPVL